MAECPCCKAPIDLADVIEQDKEPSTMKYYKCPVCKAGLTVYLKIDYLIVTAEEEEE